MNLPELRNPALAARVQHALDRKTKPTGSLGAAMTFAQREWVLCMWWTST